MPYDDSTRQSPPVYVVMESNLLIAEDISGALEALGPCRVIRITAESQLAEMVEQDAPVSAAFLEMRYEQALSLGLHESFLLRGAKIVLTVGEGDEAAVTQHGWAMLVRPFTEEMIHETLLSSVREA